MPQSEDIDWNFPVLVEDVVMPVIGTLMGGLDFSGSIRLGTALTYVIPNTGLTLNATTGGTRPKFRQTDGQTQTDGTITWQPDGLVDATREIYSGSCYINTFGPSNTRGSAAADTTSAKQVS